MRYHELISEAPFSISSLIKQAVAIADHNDVDLELEKASSGRSWSHMLPKTPRAKTIVLGNINARVQQQGAGSKVMSELCRLADQSGLFLVTMPVPSANGMSKGKLTNWYMDFGFVYPNGPWHGFLVRAPVSDPSEDRV